MASADPAAMGIKTGAGVEAIVASAPIEEEISRLPPDEQKEFLADLGLDRAERRPGDRAPASSCSA